MNDETITIEPMRRRHLRAVLAIETTVNPKPWTMDILRSELALTATRRYFVATAHRTVVGFVGVMLAVDDGHITNIAVSPDCQRQHIATQLMLVASRAAIEAGMQAMTLEVRRSNLAAQGLYRRFGFAPVGVRKAYYSQPVEDALVMWVHDVHETEHRMLLEQLEARLAAPVQVRRDRVVVSNELGAP